MTLDQIEAIVAVVENGSFRAAAEALHRSQPALSTTIKNLEEEFDILIFDRSEYRPKLTEAGAAFLSTATAALDAARYASRVGVELGKNKVETRLNIAVDPLVSTEVIEVIAQECARPPLPVNLVIDKTILKGSYKALLSGEIDLALAPRPPGAAKVEAIPLENVTLVGAVSRRLLQEKRRPTEAFLAKNPQILVYDKRFDEPPDELLPHAVHTEHGHKIFVPDHFTKLNLIAGGIGWGRISKNEFEQNPELCMVDRNLFPHVELELCLLRPKHRPVGPIARTIWKVFEERARKK
jgi:DNA-binding transcriptional LysR family regulator